MLTENQEIDSKLLVKLDVVILKFNESDAEIARNWQYPTKANALIVRPRPRLA